MPPNATVTQLRTRRPTGKPPWPIMLLAGAEKVGKSWACAEASASKLIHRTFWVSVGEDDPDEYGILTGADFEIVLHDGSHKGILAALAAAEAEADGPNGEPNLIIVDSGGRYWEQLSDMAQAEANARAARKARAKNQHVSEDDQKIAVDLWNTAKDRWTDVLDILRRHNGPSIITARLEMVAVMGPTGEPTGEKVQKVKAQKGLPFDVGVIVELPERGKAFLTGVRSARFTSTEARTEFPEFTVEKLWTKMGVAEQGATSERTYVNPVTDLGPVQALLAEIATLADSLGIPRATIASEWAEAHDGQPLRDTSDVGGLELLRDDLAARMRLEQERAERQRAIGVREEGDQNLTQFLHEDDFHATAGAA